MESEIPHFIGSVEDVKRLLRMVFEEDEEISMVRIGECLVFSDMSTILDDSTDSPLLVSPEMLRNFQVKNTFLHVPVEADSLARTVSAPARSLDWAQPPRDTFSTNFQSRHKELRKVTWDLGPFKLLLACEVGTISVSPTTKPVNYKCLSVLESRGPSVFSRSTAWLENSVLAIDQVAFVRGDGSVQFIETSDLVSSSLLIRLQQLLEYLHSQCKEQGVCYTLSNRKNEFNLSMAAPFSGVHPSLVLPIAELALKICHGNLLENSEDKINLLTRTLQLNPSDVLIQAQLALELVAVAPPSASSRAFLSAARAALPTAETTLAVRLAVAEAEVLLKEASDENPEKVAEAWEVLKSGVAKERRRVECGRLEISILRKLLEFGKKRATKGEGVEELKNVLENLLEICEESEKGEIFMDLAEVAFSMGFPKKDRTVMKKGRKYLVTVIGNCMHLKNKALVAIAKNFTAESTMIGNFKRALTLISLAILEISEDAKEALAGEHFIAAKNVMIGNLFVAKTKSIDLGEYEREWVEIKNALGNSTLEISDLSALDHLEACLRLAESERLQGLAHLEIAKLLGQDRKNERKYLLALRHAQKAVDLLPLVDGSVEISGEAVRILASLQTRKDVRKSLEILCDAEISGLDVRPSMLDICLIMLKELPDGRAKDGIKHFYAAALRGSLASDLKKTL